MLCHMAGTKTQAKKRESPRHDGYVTANACQDSEKYWAILGVGPRNAREITERIKKGLPFQTVQYIQDAFSLDRSQVAAALHMSVRTLDRRRRTGKLDALESDRAYRLMRVFWSACEMYGGNFEAALAWWKRKNKALGGLSPEETVSTDPGKTLVENLILRIEHGVYS